MWDAIVFVDKLRAAQGAPELNRAALSLSSSMASLINSPAATPLGYRGEVAVA